MADTYEECDEDIKRVATSVAEFFVEISGCDARMKFLFRGGIAAALDDERARHLPPPPNNAKTEKEE